MAYDPVTKTHYSPTSKYNPDSSGSSSSSSGGGSSVSGLVSSTFQGSVERSRAQADYFLAMQGNPAAAARLSEYVSKQGIQIPPSGSGPRERAQATVSALNAAVPETKAISMEQAVAAEHSRLLEKYGKEQADYIRDKNIQEQFYKQQDSQRPATYPRYAGKNIDQEGRLRALAEAQRQGAIPGGPVASTAGPMPGRMQAVITGLHERTRVPFGGGMAGESRADTEAERQALYQQGGERLFSRLGIRRNRESATGVSLRDQGLVFERPVVKEQYHVGGKTFDTFAEADAFIRNQQAEGWELAGVYGREKQVAALSKTSLFGEFGQPVGVKPQTGGKMPAVITDADRFYANQERIQRTLVRNNLGISVTGFGVVKQPPTNLLSPRQAGQPEIYEPGTVFQKNLQAASVAASTLADYVGGRLGPYVPKEVSGSRLYQKLIVEGPKGRGEVLSRLLRKAGFNPDIISDYLGAAYSTGGLFVVSSAPLQTAALSTGQVEVPAGTFAIGAAAGVVGKFVGDASGTLVQSQMNKQSKETQSRIDKVLDSPMMAAFGPVTAGASVAYKIEKFFNPSASTAENVGSAANLAAGTAAMVLTGMGLSKYVPMASEATLGKKLSLRLERLEGEGNPLQMYISKGETSNPLGGLVKGRLFRGEVPEAFRPNVPKSNFKGDAMLTVKTTPEIESKYFESAKALNEQVKFRKIPASMKKEVDFLTDVRSLQGEGEYADFFRAKLRTDKEVVGYGGMGDVARNIKETTGDIDLMIRSNKASAIKAQEYLKELQELRGSPMRVNQKTPSLIEIQKGTSWAHLVDIHGPDSLEWQAGVRMNKKWYAYARPVVFETEKIGRIKFRTLSEETAAGRAAAVMPKAQELTPFTPLQNHYFNKYQKPEYISKGGVFEPAPHRLKDVESYAGRIERMIAAGGNKESELANLKEFKEAADYKFTGAVDRTGRRYEPISGRRLLVYFEKVGGEVSAPSSGSVSGSLAQSLKRSIMSMSASARGKLSEGASMSSRLSSLSGSISPSKILSSLSLSPSRIEMSLASASISVQSISRSASLGKSSSLSPSMLRSLGISPSPRPRISRSRSVSPSYASLTSYSPGISPGQSPSPSPSGSLSLSSLEWQMSRAGGGQAVMGGMDKKMSLVLGERSPRRNPFKPAKDFERDLIGRGKAVERKLKARKIRHYKI